MKLTKTKKIFIFIAVLAIVLCGRFFLNQTTLFVNTNTTVPASFLPINDYVLQDMHTGKPTQKIKSLHYEFESTNYDYPNDLETSLGIHVNSSWQDFVDAYGPYKAEYISCSKVGIYDNPDYVASEDDYYSYRWMTIDDFNETYVKTGIIPIEDYTFYIDFIVRTKFTDVYYTPAEQLKADEHNFFWDWRIHEFTLSFTFNDEGTQVFDYILSDCHTY